MKKAFLSIPLLLLATIATAVGDESHDEKVLRIALSNFIDRNLECSLYYTAAAVNAGRIEGHGTANAYTLAQRHLKMAVMSAQTLDMTTETIKVKMEHFMKQMREETDDDLTNFSVLTKKYADSCKRLYEHTEEEIELEMQEAERVVQKKN